jgi:hypothetical protein
MRVYSHRFHSVLACTLIVLFFALSFNAYACLLPVNAVTPAAMANGCATPDEQPVSQYCDAFKTLGVQSADKLQLTGDFQTICSEDTASLALRIIHTSPSSRSSDHPIIGLPKDLLLKISVLRI